MRALRTWAGVLVVAGSVACEPEPDIIENERLDAWCGEDRLCSWHSEGRIERVGTWWPSDWGVSLRDDPTVLSQRTFEGEAYGCVQLRARVDVDPEVTLSFEVDLEDDGSVEGSFPMEGRDFELVTRDIRLPAAGWIDVARLAVVKRGPGRAVIAQAFVDRVSSAPAACDAEPLNPAWDEPSPQERDAGP